VTQKSLQGQLIDADFGEVNELRNIVFHFRRGIIPKDTDRLRRFRDRLRYDRELYVKHTCHKGVTAVSNGTESVVR
jgi:hypothetical protein